MGNVTENALYVILCIICLTIVKFLLIKTYQCPRTAVISLIL